MRFYRLLLLTGIGCLVTFVLFSLSPLIQVSIQKILFQSHNHEKGPDWRLYPPLSLQNQTWMHQFETERWYGNSAEVGTSPYDFKPRSLRSGENKTRLLFLLDFKDYIERMNSHSFELVDAALVHPRVEVDVWGHGWAGWNENKSLAENLAARILPGTTTPVGCGYYHAYWTISAYPDRKESWVDNAGCGTLHIHQLGDCHSDECIDQLFVQSGNISATKYSFELLDMLPYERLMDKHSRLEMQLYTHSPDAANPWDYYPLSRWSEKKDGAVLFGATHALYTIRPRIEHAIRNNLTFITQFKHPGFILYHSHLPKTKLLTYDPKHPSYKAHIRKRSEFADGMRNAQICIFDSSMEKKAIRKYAQAFLSGCVVAADIPTEQEEAFRNFMIPLRTDASIEEINRVIYDALLDPFELQRKALEAFAYAREYLTNSRKVDRILHDMEMYREGERGYSFAMPLSLSCRKYWKLTVPWCKGSNKPRYPSLDWKGPS